MFRTGVLYPLTVEHLGKRWRIAIYFPIPNGNWWFGEGDTLKEALRSVFGQIEVFVAIAKDWRLL